MRDLVTMIIRLGVLTVIITLSWAAYIYRAEVLGTYQSIVASLPTFSEESASESIATTEDADGQIRAMTDDGESADREAPSASATTTRQQQPTVTEAAVAPPPAPEPTAAEYVAEQPAITPEPDPATVSEPPPEAPEPAPTAEQHFEIVDIEPVTEDSIWIDKEIPVPESADAPAAEIWPELPAEAPANTADPEQDFDRVDAPPVAEGSVWIDREISEPATTIAPAAETWPEVSAGRPAPMDSTSETAPIATPGPVANSEPLAQPRQPARAASPWAPPTLHPLAAARRAAWLRQYADSLEHYRKSIALDPENIDAWGEMGNVLLAAGRDSEAARAFYQAAIKLAARGHTRYAMYLSATIRRIDPQLADDLDAKLPRRNDE